MNPYRVKLHRSYSASELAELVGVHKNTIRHWQRNGMVPIDGGRPILFKGSDVRAFVAKRIASRKQPCPPGTLFCFRCRAPRAPALGMLDYNPMTEASGNLHALCETCDGRMHRRIRLADMAVRMPGMEVQIRQAEPRLKGRPQPSLNCDFERQE